MSKVISEICGATGQGSDNTVRERRLQISGFVGPELCPRWSDGGPGRSRKRLQSLHWRRPAQIIREGNVHTVRLHRRQKLLTVIKTIYS